MIINISNILTILRIILTPIILYYLLNDSEYNRYIAVIFFTIACITDYLDGYFARTFSLNTKFGKIFDPIADKMLVIAVLISLVKLNRINIVIVIIIALREIFISGLREFTNSKQIKLDVTKLAKVKTASQMLGIILLIFGEYELFNDSFIVGQYLMILSAFLTVYTGCIYIKQSYKHIISQ